MLARRIIQATHDCKDASRVEKLAEVCWSPRCTDALDVTVEFASMVTRHLDAMNRELKHLTFPRSLGGALLSKVRYGRASR